MKMIMRTCALALYLLTVVLANWLTARYGFVPVGFGLAATAGTYAAGMAFVARDAVQDAAGRAAALGVLVAGAALSWLLASPQLAIASFVAFAISELLDMVIYTPLRRRGYVRAALASNVAGSITDTLIFLWLAGFGLAPIVILGQLVGKVWVTLAVVVGVLVVRAVFRKRVIHQGA